MYFRSVRVKKTFTTLFLSLIILNSCSSNTSNENGGSDDDTSPLGDTNCEWVNIDTFELQSDEDAIANSIAKYNDNLYVIGTADKDGFRSLGSS